MRALSPTAQLALVLLAGVAACLRVDDISLGVLARDAGASPDELPPAPDSATPAAIAPVDATDGSAPDHERDEDAASDPVEPDAGAAPAATADASSLDASASDARVDGGDANQLDAGDGAAREPAEGGADAARSLLCTFEPWHCL